MHTLAATLDTISLADWVTTSSERCLGGRTLLTAVNHRTRIAIELTEDDLGPEGTIDPTLVSQMRDGGFLAESPDPTPPSPSRAAGIGHFLETLDISWPNANALVERLHRMGLRHVFHPIAVLTQVVVALLGVAATVDALRSGPDIHLHVDSGSVWIVILCGLLAVAVHELAHALVVIHHGRSIDSIGFRLHLGTPSFYVESVEALLLTRRQRIIQAAAGPWAEWLFTSLLAIGLWAVAPGGLVAVLLTRFVVLNAATVLSNLLPFGGLDGSHLLADLLRVPDLQRRSRSAPGRLVRAITTDTPLHREDLWLSCYSLLNMVVAATLFLASMAMWVAMFGDLVAELWASGTAGAALVVMLGALFGRPALIALAPSCVSFVLGAERAMHDIRFRRSVKWRRAAMHELRRTVPSLAVLDEHALGVAAGLLTPVRPRTGVPTNCLATVSLPPMPGARRGITASLDQALLDAVADGLNGWASTSPRQEDTMAGALPAL